MHAKIAHVVTSTALPVPYLEEWPVTQDVVSSRQVVLTPCALTHTTPATHVHHANICSQYSPRETYSNSLDLPLPSAAAGPRQRNAQLQRLAAAPAHRVSQQQNKCARTLDGTGGISETCTHLNSRPPAAAGPRPQEEHAWWGHAQCCFASRWAGSWPRHSAW